MTELERWALYDAVKTRVWDACRESNAPLNVYRTVIDALLDALGL